MDRFQHYIDGSFADGTATFESLDPASGQPWARMPDASPAEVDRAARAADRALHSPAWAGLTASARGRLDRFELEGRAFFDAVRSAFLARAKADPSRYVLIDAAQPLTQVQRSLDALLPRLLELTRG